MKLRRCKRFKVFECFRVTYDLQRDLPTFRQHIQYLADQQHDITFTELTPELINQPIALNPAPRSKSSFARPVSKCYGLAMEQEKENTSIWGLSASATLPTLHILKPPVPANQLAK